jgi:tricorn protease
MMGTILKFLLLFATASACFAQSEQPMLLQKPTLSRDQVAFVCAGDLWIVGRDGGDAKRLTTGTGVETNPHFSPDGSQIAFNGTYDGNVDVYVVPAGRGVPRRLTYHPDPDEVVGWTPDGKSVLFRSPRDSGFFLNRLFAVSVLGGFPREIELPTASDGCYSPDGSRLAYVPITQSQPAWKRYRGGETRPIWIADLQDSRVIQKIPRDNSNDFNPMWLGDKIYFLSDRSGPVTLFAYDVNTNEVTKILPNDGLDLKSACSGPGAIVYEQFGSLHLFDPASGASKPIGVRLAGDMPEVRPSFRKVDTAGLGEAGLSPTGARAVFQARGEIVTVPAEKGDIRNLTQTPGVAERYPAWSPDGKWIAYFSDESGEYALHLRDQSGMGEVRKIKLGNPPSFFYTPVWSPDNKKIAYTDKRLNLWYVNLKKGAPVLVDTDTYDTPYRALDPVWSPDGRWLAYTKKLRNHLRAVFVFSTEEGRSRQVTDGMSEAMYAAFDKNGEYLYFTASTDVGLTAAWLDLSSVDRPVSRSVYVVVLNKDLPSPLAPESDEEGIDAKKSEETAAASDKARKELKNKNEKDRGEPAKEDPSPVRIDFENISQRILALPIPEKNYKGLFAGKANEIFLLEGPVVEKDKADGPPDIDLTLVEFDLVERKTETILEGIKSFALSYDGEKMLYRRDDQWFISADDDASEPEEKALNLDELVVYVDPRAEWKQMYHEVWRIERDFLYDPGLHGLDLGGAESFYASYLHNLASRADLNYLFEEMLGELSIGHMFVDGGDLPDAKKVKGGLLGADYRIENGRYRFDRVYSGENWNPQLRAPLTQPGVNVAAGEYLLAVQGRELRAADNIYAFFEGTADKSVTIKVGPKPDGSGSRDVTVVPLPSETALRNLAWIEDNRRKVDELTGGRVAYVYLPNTAGAGYTNFNRYYFSQIGKEACIIDERFNQGGYAADYIIDYLRRPLLNYWTTREGEDLTEPIGAIFGPKVMLINESAGSGGDALPWYFRESGIGPLIGKTTWGGLVGIYDYPALIDGGSVTAPRIAFYNLSGEWDVENHGVAPDIEVEFDPQAWRAGHDPQLEKAVQVVLELLAENPLPTYERPVYPNYHLQK